MAKVTGFFSTEKLYSVGLNGPSCGDCERCGLHKNCKTPRMNVAGEGARKILIVGQYPSSTEDRTGIPMSGESGDLLKSKLTKMGIDFDKDVWRTHAVACFPGKDNNDKVKKVTRDHIKCCKIHLLKVIADLKPLHVWLMGSDAIASYFMDREDDCSAIKWRGICVPDPDRKVWVVPMYTTTDITKKEKDENFQATFDRDLAFAVRCSKYSMVPEHVTLGKCVTIIKEYDDVIQLLETVIERCPERLAFDFETTGLKPYRSGHRIASMSFCYDYDHAYSFPYEYRKHFTRPQLERIADLWIEIMLNPRIKKIAHNEKFEDSWTREIFGIDIANPWWCTMNCAHILDTRTGITGLKFQALIRWGIPDYDSHMDKYKKATKDSPYNHIMEAPLNDLLLYGGIDSLLTFRLQEEQEDELKPFPGMQKAREFWMEGLHTLCDIQENGITMNKEYYIKQDECLEVRIAEMEKALYKFPEAIRFQQVKNRPLNFGSSTDLAELFFKILELPRGKQTDGGNDCTDAGVLAELNTPIAKELTKIAKLKKIKGTYLGQFLREIDDDGKMRPFFDLHVPRTIRGCVAKGTKILVVRDFEKYPEGIPIEEVKEGDLVYCFDDKLDFVIKKVLWSGKTGHKEIIRLHWRSKNRVGYLDVTPEHLVRHTSGKYIPAKDLVGDLRGPQESRKAPKIRVLACYRNYDMLYATGLKSEYNTGIYEHQLIYEQLIGSIPNKYVIHHKDNNHLNHEPTNLQCLTVKEHGVITSTGKVFTEETKKLIAQTRKINKQLGLHKDMTGENHPGYLKLSKFECLRLLAKASGKMKFVNHNFGTFKNYLIKHEINQELVKLRYDKNGKYITKKRFSMVHENKGIEGCRQTFGHNYYRLQKLYAFFNIPFIRRWGNQTGICNNHIITRVEWLHRTEDVYDIEVEDCHNFIANEICVHNSSSRPNFQNIPVRDEEAKKITRDGIMPSILSEYVGQSFEVKQ